MALVDHAAGWVAAMPGPAHVRPPSPLVHAITVELDARFDAEQTRAARFAPEWGLDPIFDGSPRRSGARQTVGWAAE
jgi:hypothetical protein